MIASADFSAIRDSRENLRTHMFAAATLLIGSRVLDVRIRNMSPTGALVDGNCLPEAGSTIILQRGHLEVRGQIAWETGGRAGILFDHVVDVGNWLAAVGTTRRAPGLSAQAPKAPSGHGGSAPRQGLSPSLAEGGVSLDLRVLKAELSRLVSALESHADVLARVPELRDLEMALMRVDRLIARERGQS